MFKSKVRPIVIPQSEHLKLAGTLALVWGNVRFDFPPFPRLSVVTGIALHDRAFGYLDTVAIREAADEDWLPLTRRGFFMPCSDPVADLITRLHLRRLVIADDTPARRALAQEMELAIEQQLAQHGFSREVFERIDRITNFCDRVSVDFCFEQPAQGAVQIYPRNVGQEALPLQYQIDAGEIAIAPWPLSVETCQGYLVGYQRAGYPERLDPVILPYRIRPAERL